jgi:intermembrane space import and assembly protein 40
MQNCFREYPEIYGNELDTDEDLDDMTAEGAETPASQPSSAPAQSSEPSQDKYAQQERAKQATEQVRQEHGDSEKQYVGPAKVEKSLDSNAGDESKKQRAEAAKQQVEKQHEPVSESDAIIPKAAFDGTVASKK